MTAITAVAVALEAIGVLLVVILLGLAGYELIRHRRVLSWQQLSEAWREACAEEETMEARLRVFAVKLHDEEPK